MPRQLTCKPPILHLASPDPIRDFHAPVCRVTGNWPTLLPAPLPVFGSAPIFSPGDGRHAPQQNTNGLPTAFAAVDADVASSGQGGLVGGGETCLRDPASQIALRGTQPELQPTLGHCGWRHPFSDWLNPR